MADNKDINRPLDSEELTAEQEEKVSGGMEAGSGSDRPPLFNISYFNTANVNTSYLSK
ncbi:MAG: hypothetical protein K6F54_11455 [Lachnospiraceae bacterium]|nr:hypothetical protein [Lachnospiraceae bacterium]